VAKHLNGTFSEKTTSKMTILMAMTWPPLSVQHARGISPRWPTIIITRHLAFVHIAGGSSDARACWVVETTTADSWHRTSQLVLLYIFLLFVRNNIARNLAQ
jgi:hypothetical protein